VAAAVVIRPGAVVTKRLLRKLVRSQLSPQKVPRSITFVTEIPKTPTGKPLRSELAAAAGAQFTQPASGGVSSGVERHEETAFVQSDADAVEHRGRIRR
jgi:hypothetical protein